MAALRKAFFSSLTFRIGAAVIFVEFAILLVLGYFYISRFHHEIDSKLQQNLELPGKLIASGTLTSDAISDRKTFSTLIGQELVDGIVFDRDLLVTHALNPRDYGKAVTDLKSINPAWFEVDGKSTRIIPSMEGGSSFLVSVAPILAYDGITATSYIYIKINSDQANREKYYIERLFFTGSIIAIVLTSFFLIALFRRHISNRIRDTKDVLARVEGNDFSARVKPSGIRDELTILQNQVNSMVAALGDSFNNLKEEIAGHKQTDQKLTYQATHDTLTGLVNRREFESRTRRCISTVGKPGEEHALCFMDLDQFKLVNDTCGHAAGDEMLRQLSAVLTRFVRKRDTLARLGGDEFGILMEHCSAEDAYRVATSLQKAVQDYRFTWEGQGFRVGASMGLVAITESTTDLTQLLKDADTACYMAKDKGRNRIHVYHADDTEMAERYGEMQWMVRLNQALEEDRLCLYAQPIVSLESDQATHYEVLVRMIDENGDIIPPGAFLPAAERYNLISSIDHWVIEKTLSLLTQNPSFLRQITFCSINLSGESLTNADTLKFIIDKLQETGVDANKICFEITETAAISNMHLAENFIVALKQRGCRFALDDFGSGLSSFGYLKYLPVDFLKIDGIFVKDIVEDPIDRAMVRSINEIGHVMQMQTIAEFVENDIIKGILKEIGVDYVQGYGIGKPCLLQDLLDRPSNVQNLF